jgi:hypothetical protein
MSFAIMKFVLSHGAHTAASHIDSLADGAVFESQASVEVEVIRTSRWNNDLFE